MRNIKIRLNPPVFTIFIFSFAIFALTVMINKNVSAQGVRQGKAAYGSKLINRGRYLVEDVGKCSDCHTPRDRFGRPIKAKWLEGTVLNMKPIHPVPGWAEKSVNIAGLPKGWTENNMIKFLTTGINPKGKFARPPMPVYRLTKEDAIAVTYYLKSLKPKK